MTRYHSYPSRDDNSYWWLEPLFAIILVVVLIWSVHACQAADREKCEKSGGVWLVRESACVAGPGANPNG